jgi:hypothetical protein
MNAIHPKNENLNRQDAKNAKKILFSEQTQRITTNSVGIILQAEVDRRVMEFVNAEIQAYRAEKAQQK